MFNWSILIFYIGDLKLWYGAVTPSGTYTDYTTIKAKVFEHEVEKNRTF